MFPFWWALTAFVCGVFAGTAVTALYIAADLLKWEDEEDERCTRPEVTD